MVEISLLSGWDSITSDVQSEGEELTARELLEITQDSSIIDLYFDTDCVSVLPPHIVEVK